MELLTIQHIGESKPMHIITACGHDDTCPSCGAGYKAGLSACEYCRTPVKPLCKPASPPNEPFGVFEVRGTLSGAQRRSLVDAWAKRQQTHEAPAEAPPVNRFSILPAGEFFMPAYVAKELGLS